jgi:hypothetical protein
MRDLDETAKGALCPRRRGIGPVAAKLCNLASGLT